MRVLGLGIRSLLLAAIGPSACAVDDRSFTGEQPVGESGAAPPGAESAAPLNGMAPASAGGAGGEGVAPGAGSGNAGSSAAGMAGTSTPAAGAPGAVFPAPAGAGNVGMTIGGDRLNTLVSTGVVLSPGGAAGRSSAGSRSVALHALTMST